jgi:hypothetical protein
VDKQFVPKVVNGDPFFRAYFLENGQAEGAQAGMVDLVSPEKRHGPLDELQGT